MTVSEVDGELPPDRVQPEQATAKSETARGAFRSLTVRNFRLWAAGAFVSNVGTWMQRVAQDWLVLTELTHRNATAVGIVTALQFAPQILLLPVTGYVADHWDRRKVLLATQGSMAALAFGLGLLVVTGLVQLWHVYAFALMLGIVAAFDIPARHTFVAELVGDKHLSNAVALNSTSFNAARMIGPAVSGVLIAAVGTGFSFLINGAATLAVVGSLLLVRVRELNREDKADRPRGGVIDGFRYVQGRPDLKAALGMLFLFGTFGLNFAIFISTMSVKVFHAGAGEYGLLTSAMAVGSVTGAFLAAKREKPSIPLIVVGAILFSIALTIAAVMPNYWMFGIVLVFVGVSAQTITTSSMGLVQLSTDKHVRGRVMALLLAITLGGLSAGGPFMGWIADHAGPRWAMGLGAMAGFAAAGVGLRYLMKHQGFRVRREGWRVRVSVSVRDGTTQR